MFPDTREIALVSAAFSAVAYVRYCWTIHSGKTVSSLAAWFVWLVVGTMIAITYARTATGDSKIPPMIYAGGTLLVFIVSWSHNSQPIGWREKIAFPFAILGLLVWWQFHSVVAGLYIEMIVDCFGAIGVVENAYRNPEKEDLPTWLLSSIGALINLFAVRRWGMKDFGEFAEGFYPTLVVFMCLAILGTAYFRSRECQRNTTVFNL